MQEKFRYIAIALIISISLSLTILIFGSSEVSYNFNLPNITKFNADEAYELGKYFAKKFPHKYTGSEDAIRATQWLENQLKNWGYKTIRQEFIAKLGNDTKLINVIGYKEGKSKDQILILTNFDQAPTSYESAYTSAAVGVVLSLAHLLSNEILNKTLVIAFVDGEEWGMLGAAYLAKNYPFDKSSVVALVPEYVDVGNAVAIAVDPIGQFSGYSPFWLRELIRTCTLKVGLKFYEPLGFEEYAQRAVLISFTDQGPLLRYGIPAVQFSTVGDNPELSREVYHMPQDVYELNTKQAIEVYGKVTECATRTLDSIEVFPQSNEYYLAISENKIITFPFLAIAQFMLFIPLYIATYISLKNNSIERKELIFFLIIFVSLIISYLFAKALTYLGVMPYYELYPPPPRFPLLYNVNFFAMGIWTLLTFALIFIVFWKLEVNANKLRSLAFLVLSLVSISYLIYNPFGATLLLLPASYLWLFIKIVKSKWNKILNISMLLMGGIMVYLLVLIYSQRIYLDPLLMLWYLFMGVSYNLFTLPSMLIYITTLAAAFTLLRAIIKK